MRLSTIFLFFMVSVCSGEGQARKPSLTNLEKQVDDNLRKTKQEQDALKEEEAQKLLEEQKKKKASRKFRWGPDNKAQEDACRENPGSCRLDSAPPTELPAFGELPNAPFPGR